jgi:Holliday junction resolvasome RuvABC ATP-dependent DNA helicase subunit
MGHAGNKSNFGQDFITTMLKAMEDYKDRLIVIFAGYKDEMDGFMKSNPGLQSRIGYTLNFADYSPEELLEILLQKLGEMGLDVSEAARAKIEGVIAKAVKIKNFGNARFIMNLIQYIIIKHAENTEDETNEDNLKTIEEDDVDETILDKLGMEKHLGFGDIN